MAAVIWKSHRAAHPFSHSELIERANRHPGIQRSAQLHTHTGSDKHQKIKTFWCEHFYQTTFSLLLNFSIPPELWKVLSVQILKLTSCFPHWNLENPLLTHFYLLGWCELLTVQWPQIQFCFPNASNKWLREVKISRAHFRHLIKAISSRQTGLSLWPLSANWGDVMHLGTIKPN